MKKHPRSVTNSDAPSPTIHSTCCCGDLNLFNAVFKVERYAPDYPGLRGRDLSPKGVIERPASDKGKTGLDKADAPPDEGRGGRGGR